MIEIPQEPFVFLLYAPTEQAIVIRLRDVLRVYGINVVGHDFQDVTGDTAFRIRLILENAEAVIALAPSDEQLRRVSISEEAARAIPINTREGYEKTLASLIQVLEAKGFFSAIHIRINEDPLTAHNLSTILSALTELSTKYWLTAKGRFADLIEYTQTHNDQFAEEANIVVMRITHNSPVNIDWKVDLSAPSVAEALVTTIDGVAQGKERLEKAKLENQAKALEIKVTEQKVEREGQMALLEQEKQRLEIEQRRLEVLEKRLEVQMKAIEYALEIAGKVVNVLHPGADPATQAMVIQTFLPNILQLDNGKGLELALPPPPPSVK